MPGIQEYVIRLGADIDNTGIQKLLALLDTNKMKALGLTAALTAATTAVYKWVESATKQEIELDKLAKKQGKSIAQTRAEEQALKSMGMTLNDIKKDAALKSIYDDLVKFNKEMQMPNAANMIGKVREMQSAFWKLRSAVNYLVQSIGSQLLINLEKPIERITNKLSGAANWIKNNLTSVGTKITGYLTAFSKGVIGIVEGVGKIFNWLGQMPEGIKSIAGTLGTVFALIKSGPLGQIMALITAAGDLIHDYENSQWNKDNQKNTQFWNDGKGGYTDKPTEFGAYQVPLMYENLWNFLESDTGDLRSKAKTITLSILEGISDALSGFSDTLASGKGVIDWLGELTGPVGDILGGVADVFNEEEGQQAVGKVITKFFQTAALFLSDIGNIGTDITGSIVQMLVNIFGGENGKKIWADSNVSKLFDPTNKNGFMNGLMTSIETSLVGGDFWTSLITGVVSGYETERLEALQKLYNEDHPEAKIDWSKALLGENGVPSYEDLENMYGGDSRLGEALGKGLQDSFNDFIGGVLETLAGGITIASDKAGNILRIIVGAILNTIGGLENSDLGKNIQAAMSDDKAKNGLDAVASGIAAWIFSGDGLIGLIAGSIVEFIQAGSDAKKNQVSLAQQLSADLGGIWGTIANIIVGPMVENIETGKMERDFKAGLLYGLFDALKGVTDLNLGSLFLQAILDVIFGSFNLMGTEGANLQETITSAFNKDDVQGTINAIGSGLLAWLFTGDGLIGLIVGSATELITAASDAEANGTNITDELSKKLSGLFDAIVTVFLGQLEETEPGSGVFNRKLETGLLHSLVDVAKKAINSDFAGQILTEILGALFSAFSLLGEDVGILGSTINSALNREDAKKGIDAISTGLVGWILSGDGLVGLIAGGINLAADAAVNAEANGTTVGEEIKKIAEGLWNMVLDIVLGPMEEPQTECSGTSTRGFWNSLRNPLTAKPSETFSAK